MSEIMSHKQWLSLTHGGYNSVRSSELKSVDKALEAYHRSKSEASLDELTRSLLKWIQSKGPAWKSSVRNKRQGVEILHNQLMGLGNKKLNGAEMVALSHVRNESRAIIDDLFQNQRLEWRNSFKEKLGQQKFGTTLNTAGAINSTVVLTGAKGSLQPAANSAASAATSATSAASKAIRGPTSDSLARDLYQSIVPPELATDVANALASISPDFFKELAAALTPWVGVVTSGGASAWNAKNSLRGKWRVEMSEYHVSRGLAIGEPEAAFAGLKHCLQRELNADVFSMSVSLVEFGSKLAGTLADAGTVTTTAIGLASNVIKLVNIVRIIIRDILERNAANKLMNTRVDLTVFDTCPVVGAYLICCVPTSVLVNAIFEDRFGEPGWQSQVEVAVKKHLSPLKVQAERVIREHRFVIPGLVGYPGLVKLNQKKLDEMMENKGKTGMIGVGSTS